MLYLDEETKKRLAKNPDFAQLVAIVQDRHVQYRNRLESGISDEEVAIVRGRIKELKEIMSLVLEDYKLPELER